MREVKTIQKKDQTEKFRLRKCSVEKVCDEFAEFFKKERRDVSIDAQIHGKYGNIRCVENGCTDTVCGTVE